MHSVHLHNVTKSCCPIAMWLSFFQPTTKLHPATCTASHFVRDLYLQNSAGKSVPRHSTVECKEVSLCLVRCLCELGLRPRHLLHRRVLPPGSLCAAGLSGKERREPTRDNTSPRWAIHVGAWTAAQMTHSRSSCSRKPIGGPSMWGAWPAAITLNAPKLLVNCRNKTR